MESAVRLAKRTLTGGESPHSELGRRLRTV